MTGEPCVCGGRSWTCNDCGRVWSPEPKPPPELWFWINPDDDDPRWPK